MRNAAAQPSQAARDLKDAGLSGRDIAAILRVSAQRASQLLAEVACLAVPNGHETPSVGRLSLP
jgi:hypothetical protein